eukprot:CAMPEP_0170915004 /NCGR_PEP_ID=MMETSP0735-20130129/5938_1 /TAXON_ID=186038 /ORGANISM="Fragilariopsis kerguelensis, Strain L26-C5" /LENGTH=376 /DNA_ID=CAMNT_0011312827 /DNA_START=56 /DNA_END=1186 /DNA_ORIENTATION=-
MKLPVCGVNPSISKTKKYKSRGNRVIALVAATSSATQTSNPIQSSQVNVEAFRPSLRSFEVGGRLRTPSSNIEKTSKYFAKKRNVQLKEEDNDSSINANFDVLIFGNPQMKQEVSADTDTDTDTDSDATKKVESDKSKEVIRRTQSFDVLWHGALHPKTAIKIHTLILGTHPSIKSLEKLQYFGHTMNAFWWIAGDCLGFRRASGISPSSGKPYKFASDIIHGEDKIISYEEQLEVMTSKGFGMWDLLGSCERKGSLDNDIKQEKPNAIREFCKEHPTIKRIIMANGAKQCTFFSKYFEDWWLSGELKPGDSDLSRKAFKKWSKKTNGFKDARIEICCMPGVSPAAASIPYTTKRDTFRIVCYEPGLSDYRHLNPE